MAPSTTALSSFNSYARDIELYPTPFVDGYVAPLPPTPRRHRPEGWTSPAQRLSEEILENIFKCLRELIEDVSLPCVPIKGRDAWVGTLTNDRLTNGEIEAYKTAVMRKMLYDYGRVCKAWWAGSQKGWSDIVIIGEKDAERAIKTIDHWIPIGSTRHLSLTLQMTIPSAYFLLMKLAKAIHARLDSDQSKGIIPTSQASLLKPSSARPSLLSSSRGFASFANTAQTQLPPPSGRYASTAPPPVPSKPLIPLRRLTILHSFEPEALGGINPREIQKVFALFAPDHLQFEPFAGEKVIERRSLDTVARALRFPWGYFGVRHKYRVAIQQEEEEVMLNAEDGGTGMAFVEVLKDGKLRRIDEKRRKKLEIRNRRIGKLRPVYKGPVEVIRMDTRVKGQEGDFEMNEEEAFNGMEEEDEEEMMNGLEENEDMMDVDSREKNGETDKPNSNNKSTKSQPWIVDTSEHNPFPLPKDRVAGFIYHLENKYLHLPPPHLKDMSPDEAHRREIWAQLFGENEDVKGEFAEADKVWREIADNAMKSTGWIPPLGWKVNSKIAEHLLGDTLNTWLHCLKGLSIRGHWMNLFNEIRKTARNGVLSSFDYHFVPLPAKIIERNEKGQRKHSHSPNPPLGATKSVDNVLMWDFAERPSQWTRKTERQMAKAQGITYIEPPPTRTLYWTLHIPFDIWLQQKDRVHFKGKGKTRPWLPENQEEVLQALKKFILIEGDKWDIPPIAEEEEWDNLRYFHEMVNFVLNVSSRTVKSSYPLKEASGNIDNLLDITYGRTITAKWMTKRIAKGNGEISTEYSKKIWLKREEEWWNDPNPDERRREWNANYLDSYLTDIGKEGRDVIIRKLKKKYGARQLWERCHWRLKHQDYPGVTVVVDERKE